MRARTIMESRQMLLLAVGTCRANAVAETAGLTRKPYYEWTWQQTPA
jgi:hypothetical protein